MPGTVEIPKQVKETEPTRQWTVPLPSLERLMTVPAQARPIFSDSLLRYEGQKGRQAWATLSSVTLQCLVIGVLLLLPLYYTQELPKSQLLTFLVAPPPPPPPPPAAEQVTRIMKQIQTDMLSGGQLRTPTRIPKKVQMIKEDDAPPPLPSGGGGVVGGVPGGIPGGQLGGVIGGIVSSTSNLPVVPKFQSAPPQRIRISQGVTAGMLIHKVQPPYPVLARSARIQGDVVLRAIISKEGAIQDLQLVSGHPMLVPAAIAAVKDWRYKPYLLNGQPEEVETTITVIFTLAN